MAFQVSLEEIVAEPRASAKLYRCGSLPTRLRGAVQVSSLLPDKVPGMQIERLELPPGARMVGVPHTAGTREYLSCESGQLELVASGESFSMEPGDVVVFRGDQRHSYVNRGRKVAVGYSVVMLRPID
jgi:quercetin dioxygenase-like cupin family protein